MKIVEGAEAEAVVGGQPVNVMLYGPPGTLKTTDACGAFTRDGRCGAFYIPFEENGLKVIASRGLPLPAGFPDETVKTWAQFSETIAWLSQNRHRFTGLIMDGLSPFSVNLYSQAEEQFKSSKNKFQVPMVVRTCLFTMREWIRGLGMHTVMIAHALPPAVQDGVFYPGTFEIAPKSLMRIFFGQIDTVLRVGEITQLGQPTQRVYYTGGPKWPTQLGLQPADLGQWLVKNREGCESSVVPADLGAFLRSRRPPYQGL